MSLPLRAWALIRASHGAAREPRQRLASHAGESRFRQA